MSEQKKNQSLPSSETLPNFPSEINSPLPKVFGRYQVLEQIGRGGMGEVYRVFDSNLQREVALKTILAIDRNNQTRIQRFAQEARAIAQLNHPHIVHLYDAGNVNGVLYYTMDYIKGHSLKSLIYKKKLTLSKTVVLLAKVAKAAHYAHEQGVIHRDLKPSNIMVNESGEPFVTDFGLAKINSPKERVTQSGEAMGTPCYMAPEQAEGRRKQIDHRCDVYSLGAILYEALTGKQLFYGGNMEVLLKLVKEDPPPPREVNPRIHRDLEKVCLKAIEKNKEKRYQSAQELASDLENFFQGKKLSIHHSRMLIPLSMLTVGLVMAVIFYFGWWQQRNSSASQLPTEYLSLHQEIQQKYTSKRDLVIPLTGWLLAADKLLQVSLLASSHQKTFAQMHQDIQTLSQFLEKSLQISWLKKPQAREAVFAKINSFSLAERLPVAVSQKLLERIDLFLENNKQASNEPYLIACAKLSIEANKLLVQQQIHHYEPPVATKAHKQQTQQNYRQLYQLASKRLEEFIKSARCPLEDFLTKMQQASLDQVVLSRIGETVLPKKKSLAKIYSNV